MEIKIKPQNQTNQREVGFTVFVILLDLNVVLAEFIIPNPKQVENWTVEVSGVLLHWAQAVYKQAELPLIKKGNDFYVLDTAVHIECVRLKLKSTYAQ